MKKIFALLLAIVMVMGLATVVSAEDPETPASPKFTTKVQLKKLYTITGAKDVNDTADVVESDDVYPHETLSFTVAAGDPIADNTKMISVADLKVEGVNGTMAITLPDYEKVGVYTYVISETPGNAQGATYVTDQDTITVKVLVSYAADGKTLEANLYLVQENASNGTQATEIEVDNNKIAKVDTFVNKYDVGHMSVAKTVTGNLGDHEADFKVKVTFNATKTVKSTITYVEGGVVKKIDPEWTGDKPVDIVLSHGDTVNFYNIPDGVTYTVKEDNSHLLANDKTNPDPNSAVTADYTVTYGGADTNTNTAGKNTERNATGTITKDATDAVTINNAKSTSVETGIVMDSVPFVVMAVIAVLGLAAFTAKKRVQE